MNATNNIFDMFLGVSGTPPTLPQAGGNSLELNGEQPFAALFDSMLGGEVVNLIGQNGQPVDMANLQQSPQALLAESFVGQMTQESAVPTAETVVPSRFLPMGLAEPELIKSDNIIADKIIESTLQTVKTPMRPMLMTESVEVGPEQLAGGRFDVTEATVSDGKLDMVLRNSESDDTVEFRLSLPLEDVPAELQSGSGQRVKVAHGKVGVPARIALNDPGVSLAHLSEFASGLNLKSVEIDLTKANQQTASDEPTIDIKMFVQQQGREVVFRQLVPADNVSLSETRKRLYHPATASIERPAQSDISVSADQTQGQAKTDQDSLPFRTGPRTLILEPDSQGRKFIEIFETVEKSDPLNITDKKGDGRVSSDGAVDRTTTSTSTQESVRTSPPVRFTLPDGAERVLKPGSRGIMIRIEPDNIGPARLNLSFRGDALVARVTVESAAIRTMVEGSLDQLAAQLHKAGIKVDSLEVGVGSEADRQPRFGGQHRWGRQVRNGSFATYMEQPQESGALTSMLRPGHSAQVGPAGVNLYA